MLGIFKLSLKYSLRYGNNEIRCWKSNDSDMSAQISHQNSQTRNLKRDLPYFLR